MPRDAMLTPIGAPAGADTGCLPRGYPLREFIIERVLAEGGFGVVYVAIDPRLQRRVAIKEYMPAALARRAGDFSVIPRSSAPLQDAFAVGLRSFINEARMLAGFDHPALVRVLQFWEDKGTGFMVMPLYQAPTVRQWTLARAQAPEPAWLSSFFEQMLEALDLVHGVACLHRDIAPDNILLQRERDPLLLDFGAARRVIEAMTQTLTAIVKPGFAPVEQYGQSGGLRQGPWTDLYALCATVHFVLTRRPPAPAVGRVVADEYVPLARSLAGCYPAALLAAVDAGLAVRPADRPQSVADLRAMLRAGVTYPVKAVGAAPAAEAVDAAVTHAAHPTATAPLAPPAAEVRSVELPPRSHDSADAAPRTVAIWPRPLAPRTALVLATLAAVVGSAWFVTQEHCQGRAGAGVAAAAAVEAPVLSPQPITRAADASPSAAAAPVLAAEEPDPALMATGLAGPAATGPASAPPAVREAAPVATPPSPQRVAELARLRQSAARPGGPIEVRAAPRAASTEVGAAAEPPPRPADAAPALPAVAATAPQRPEAEADASRQAAALQPLEQPRPAFPAEAARDGIERGRVLARLHVGADGRVSQVDIVESVPRRRFDRAVRHAAEQWRYAPPGQPRTADVEFVFRRDG